MAQGESSTTYQITVNQKLISTGFLRKDLNCNIEQILLLSLQTSNPVFGRSARVLCLPFWYVHKVMPSGLSLFTTSCLIKMKGSNEKPAQWAEMSGVRLESLDLLVLRGSGRSYRDNRFAFIWKMSSQTSNLETTAQNQFQRFGQKIALLTLSKRLIDRREVTMSCHVHVRARDEQLVHTRTTYSYSQTRFLWKVKIPKPSPRRPSVNSSTCRSSLDRPSCSVDNSSRTKAVDVVKSALKFFFPQPNLLV